MHWSYSSVKLAIQTFTKFRKVKMIHLQIDNMTALTYLLKMWGTKSKVLLEISKEIWSYLFNNQIMITAEYLPSKLNVASSRLGISSPSRSKQLEIESTIVQDSHKTKGYAGSRSVCGSPQQSSANVLFMELF